MPQTDPFHAVVPRKLSDAELAIAMRLNLEAEMDAINLYAAHVEATDNEEARAILRHVMDEEKEHAALFKELIKRLDPAQAAHDAEAPRKYQLIVSGAPHEVVEGKGEGAPEPEARAPLASVLTVGALRPR
ncbi:MAG TPA: demethoxyubiquinone hydroxylase family protein [Myxococcales bacterium]|jgi:hypothetical protein|nr:demethoxyubiquinone hydroxylase family protein [Myxococcales bacterium]